MYLMLIIRALIVIAILYAIWLLLFDDKKTPPDEAETSDNKASSTEESWVQCHQCGLLIRENEAIHFKNRYYCSTEHLNLDSNTP